MLLSVKNEPCCSNLECVGVQSELKLDLESAQIGLKLKFSCVNRLMMGGSSIDKSDFIRFE